MNKFIIACLCVFVAVSSAADAPANPLQGILANLQNFKLEDSCMPACGAMCAAEKFFCVSIPNVVDCEAADQTCTKDCKDTCDCVAACPAKCKEANKCPEAVGGDQGAINTLLCDAKQNECTVICEEECPGQVILGEIKKVAKVEAQQIQSVISELEPKR